MRKRAVKAFLGKVYYKMAKLGINTNENLKNAKDMFDAVYNKHVYELEKNFADLFGDWVTTSKESIFQLNFALNSPSCFNRASNRFSPTGSTPGARIVSGEVVQRFCRLFFRRSVGIYLGYSLYPLFGDGSFIFLFSFGRYQKDWFCRGDYSLLPDCWDDVFCHAAG